MIFRGSRPVLLKKLYFCDFSGGGGGPDPLSPLWICTCKVAYTASNMDPDQTAPWDQSDHTCTFASIIKSSLKCF